jgi:uncharacterized protein (DUF4213/DUF364 family)
MNLKLPLKTESVDAWNGVYLFDNNDIQIGRIYNRETAEELVSSVNSCGAMREEIRKLNLSKQHYESHYRRCKEEHLTPCMEAIKSILPESKHVFLCASSYLRRNLEADLRSALSSAPVDQQKERMKEFIREVAGIEINESSPISLLQKEAAALLKELEGK